MLRARGVARCWSPALQSLDPLPELIVGELQERSGLSKLLVHVLAIFGVTALDQRVKTLSHDLDVVPDAFDEHVGVARRLSNLRAQVGGGRCDDSFDLGERFRVYGMSLLSGAA